MSKIATILGSRLWKSAEVLIEHYKNKPDDPEEPEKDPEIEEILKDDPKLIPKSPVVAEILSKLPVSGPRFLRLTENLFFCRNIKTTTFCGRSDFKGEWYTNGTNSPYPKVHRDKMKGLLGVSLPVPIKGTRKVSPINPKTGLIHTYSQVDAGPGWVDDPYWINGTPPKNEKGLDYLGNKTALAGLDFWPHVWEDMGLMTFEEAYEGEVSGYFDVLIFDPQESSVTKTKGNEVPSKDSRPWFNSLPNLGTEFFSWRELLRGWNRTEEPSEDQINNLCRLTQEILNPARKALGRLRVGSGLRDLETNKRVGGREGSFHLSGRAVDLSPLDTTFKDLHMWLTSSISQNSLRENVWEFPGQDNEHVHVALKLDNKEPSNIRIKK